MTGAAIDEALLLLARSLTTGAVPPPRRSEALTLLPALMAKAGPEAGQQASNLLRRWPDLPQEMLAHLKASPANDRDTVLAQLREQASQSTLSDAQIDEIVLRADSEAMRRLARNTSIRLTRSGLRILVSLSHQDKLLKKALVRRPDLTNAAAEHFWADLDFNERLALLQSGWRLQAAEIQEIIRETGTKVCGLDGLPVYLDAPALARQAGRLLMDNAIPQAALVLAQGAQIDPRLALQLVFGRFDRGALLLAKAAHLAPDGVLTLLVRRLPEHSERLPLNASLRIFSEIDIKEARTCLAALEQAMLWPELAQKTATH